MINLEKKCGYVALVGKPNAGKSSLLNQFVGQKISIITHKAQTTRGCVRAFAMYHNTQVVFVDTPGLFDAKKTIEKSMYSAAFKAMSEADIVFYVKDCCRVFDDNEITLLEKILMQNRNVCLVLNKVDIIHKKKLLTLCQEITSVCSFNQIFMISAKTGSGIEDLFPYIQKTLPEAEWLYPEEEIAEMPQRFFLSEITREKLILNVHKEIPYALTVETEMCKTLKNNRVRVEQIIYVERKSQKRIIIGHKGALLKHIGTIARADMKEFLQCEVDLFLFVKVSPSWQEDAQRYNAMALDKI